MDFSQSYRIAPWHRDFPGLIAGLVNMATSDDSVRLAHALSSEGLPLHVEFAAECCSVEHLSKVVRAGRPGSVDVHLMASTAVIDNLLPEVLAVRPQRVFLPWSAFNSLRAARIRRADSRACVRVWDEWNEGARSSRWATEPDGLLVMLSEPGSPERCRIRQINLISASTATYPAVPVFAAGGITEAVARLCRTAGAQQMIVGNALTRNTGTPM